MKNEDGLLEYLPPLPKDPAGQAPSQMIHRAQLPSSEQISGLALIQAITTAALNPAVDVEKMERLMAMAERIRMQRAEESFNRAMNAAQAEMRPISADATNPQTRSKYATYAKLDKAIRPIYTKHGFSLSFDEGDTDKPDHVRVLCYCAHEAGFTRTYHKDMPADGKGAKGGDVMTKTHASAAADSYGMRYLSKKIFNVAVGEDDRDGNIPDIGGLVSIDQLATLNDLIAETKSAKETEDEYRTRFCKYLKVESLGQLPEKRFAEAQAALIANRKQS